MHFGSVMAAAVTLAVVASAQAPHESPTMVLPISGLSLSVENIEEYVSKSPDVTSAIEISKSKCYRDAAGRMRTEANSIDGTLRAIVLDNPIDGFIAVLDPQTKLAHRVKFPKSSSTDGWGVGAGPNGLAGVSGKTTRKTEDLGKRTMEGIEFEGTRTTTTSDEQPSLVAVDESWGSKELGLIGLVKHSGPDSQMTSRIQNVDRTAPDPALFVIPADYRIRDVEP